MEYQRLGRIKHLGNNLNITNFNLGSPCLRKKDGQTEVQTTFKSYDKPQVYYVAMEMESTSLDAGFLEKINRNETSEMELMSNRLLSSIEN